jgi:hypothetical protein
MIRRFRIGETKILTQLLLPPKLTPLARMLRGNTSEVTIHATGPAKVSLIVTKQDFVGDTNPKSRQS